MASVMLFPNVATHRRMPHLSKESKETTTPKSIAEISPQQQRTATVLAQHSSANIDRTDNSNSSSNTTHTDKANASSLTISPAAGKNLPTLSTTSTASHTSSKIITNGTLSSPGSLLVNGTGGHSSLLPTPVGPAASTHTNGHQEQERSLHGNGHGKDQSDPSPLLPSLHNNQHHDKQQQHGHHPLNAPHGPSCISNTHLPLSGTTSTASCPSTSTPISHESRLIKTALSDAFGCLYHPVQHTHSPSPCSPSVLCSYHGTNSKASICGGSQVQTHALRSGEVTPLISPSPRVMSPMLRPHLGLSSAPITPLELTSASEDGISSINGGHGGGSAGYFGIVHGHGSGSGPSPSLGVGAASPLPSSRQLHQQHSPNHYHHHHYQQYHNTHGHVHGVHQHSLPPVPHHHPSSLLNRKGSINKHNHHAQHQQDETFLYSHPHPHPQQDLATNSGATPLSRKSSLGDIHLDPTEHPVLCSLQTLSLRHPHPANHYHPHLGHDLGHDRVSISSSPSDHSTMATVLPATPSGVLSKTTERL